MLNPNIIRYCNSLKQNINERKKYLEELMHVYIKKCNDTFDEREGEEKISKKLPKLDEKKKSKLIEIWMMYRREDKKRNQEIVKLCKGGIITCERILAIINTILSLENKDTENSLEQIGNLKNSLEQTENIIKEKISEAFSNYKEYKEVEK